MLTDQLPSRRAGVEQTRGAECGASRWKRLRLRRQHFEHFSCGTSGQVRGREGELVGLTSGLVKNNS